MATAARTLPARTLTDGGTVPKHQQLREILFAWCRGSLQPGDMLPGEREIEQLFGVSRITVRRAIGDLVNAGALVRKRGKGTFVAEGAFQHSDIEQAGIISFTKEIWARGEAASSKILATSWEEPPIEVARFFQTQLGSAESADTDAVRGAATSGAATSQDSRNLRLAQLGARTQPAPASNPAASHYFLRRLRLASGQSCSIDEAWFNADIVPDLLEHNVHESVYEILANTYKVHITKAEQVITATLATEADASLLEVPIGMALLQVHRTCFAGAVPVEWCTSLIRPDRFTVRTITSAA